MALRTAALRVWARILYPRLAPVHFCLVGTIVGLLVAEMGVRYHQGYRLWSVSLQKSFFFELDRTKVWNQRFYELRQPYFAGWPIPVELFAARKPAPRYLFKPSLRMARRGNRLRNALPGEKTFWSSNSWGFRGAEFSSSKATSTIRIICLGASTTEGSQSDDETYPYFLQQRLSQSFNGRSVEVINAGHHGHGIDDLLEVFRQRVLPLRPDLILFYEAANDIPFEDFAAGIPCKIGFPRGDCWLAPYRAWYRTAYLYSAAFGLLSAQLGWEGRVPGNMLHEFDDVTDRPAVNHYRSVLARLIREALAQGSFIALASFVTLAHEGFSVRYEENPLLFNDLYKHWYPLTAGELERIYRLYNRQSRRLAEEFNIPYFDIAAEFPKQTRYFPFDLIHLSPDGNRLLAQKLAQHIKKEVLPLFQEH